MRSVALQLNCLSAGSATSHMRKTYSSEKAVEVRFTEIAPKIDGVIEEVWQKADSAYNFVHHIPYENTEPAPASRSISAS